MASKVSDGARPVTLATVVPARLAPGHSRRCRLRRFPHPSSTFLRSLRSRPVTALRRSYGRSDSCSPALFSALPGRRGRLLGEQVSLIHALGLLTIPSPTTGASPGRLRTPSRSRPDGPPSGWGTGFRSLSAGSPCRVGRIEFSFLPPSGDSLRTGRSPPAALHPASRRRSCRLVTVWRWIELERTFTSLTKCAFRRTDSSLRSE